MNELEAYNYGVFEGKENFLTFRQTAQVGSRAIDFTVVDVDTGESKPISTFWSGRDVLIEFGSLT